MISLKPVVATWYIGVKLHEAQWYNANFSQSLPAYRQNRFCRVFKIEGNKVKSEGRFFMTKHELWSLSFFVEAYYFVVKHSALGNVKG